MTISEAQLETWSHQGSKVQSETTSQIVQNALKDPKAPYYGRSFETFLQGSYGNDTNIFADSDIDVGICFTGAYYYDLNRLDDADKAAFKRDASATDYNYDQFKAEVFAWLTESFGKSVRMGKKAIFIPGNSTRRDTDVLVCFNHREYSTYKSTTSSTWRSGICFWTADKAKIVNYPKQHLDNCVTKHQATSSRYKKNIRVLKNMRNSMKEHKYLEDGVAPSYYLEGMLWNVPENHFVPSYQQTFINCMDWLDSCKSDTLTCANNIHYLLRNTQTSWNEPNFNKFRSAARQFWKDWE